MRGPLLKGILAIGPRWNPHAIFGSISVNVQRRVRMDTGTARDSARGWILEIVEHERRDRSVASIGNVNDTGESHTEIQLEPGQYVINLRYYEAQPDARLPAIQVDDHPPLDAMPVPSNVLDYNEHILEAKAPLHRLQHHYIFPMLALRSWLPKHWVRRAYLPVGNPQTNFQYDMVERGSRIEIDVPQEVFECHLVYIVVYDRSSFPVYWTRVEDPSFTTPELDEGFYLMRFIPLAPEPSSEGVRIRSVRAY